MYQRQVSFSEAITRAFGNYVNFSGRSSRSEYWWWVLFTFIVAGAFGICQGIFMGISGESSVLATLFSYLEWGWDIAILLPSVGLIIRRLHDIDKSGWNFLWGFLPIVGTIILIIYLCRDSQMSENRYGPVPNMVTDHNPY